MANIEKAKAVVGAIKEYLESIQLEYTLSKDGLELKTMAVGEDFPVELRFVANAESERLEVVSTLWFLIKPNKAQAVMTAIAAINNILAYGKFVYYTDSGECAYEDSEYFVGLSGIGKAYAKKLVDSTFAVVDEYNDKLFALNKGLMTQRDFLSSLED